MPFIINEFVRPAALPPSEKFQISSQPVAKTLVSGNYSIVVLTYTITESQLVSI